MNAIRAGPSGCGTVVCVAKLCIVDNMFCSINNNVVSYGLHSVVYTIITQVLCKSEPNSAKAPFNRVLTVRCCGGMCNTFTHSLIFRANLQIDILIRRQCVARRLCAALNGHCIHTQTHTLAVCVQTTTSCRYGCVRNRSSKPLYICSHVRQHNEYVTQTHSHTSSQHHITEVIIVNSHIKAYPYTTRVNYV